MINNFNLIRFRCIRCGSDNITINGPRVRVKEDEEIGICEEIFQLNETTYLLAQYIIACITCKDCKNRISVTVLNHGQIE